MGIFGYSMPFDLVISRWQLLADRHDQHILVGGIYRRLARRDQFSGLILQLHAGEFRDHRFAERQPYLLGRGRCGRSGGGLADCRSAWANAALPDRLATTIATADIELTFNMLFFLQCVDRFEIGAGDARPTASACLI
jgi:hypothetical protein